jgi:hypothetical protein
MELLKDAVPKLEAWDADRDPENGWALDIKDINKWMQDQIDSCVSLPVPDEDKLKFLHDKFMEFYEYTKGSEDTV